MLPNGIRTAWAAGKPVINGWLSIGSPFTAEIMAAQGYDALTYIINLGSIADPDATFATLLEESDASDMTGATTVADGDMVSQTPGTAPLTAASFAFDSDNQVRKLGYTGSKRYTRLTITPAANASAALMSAVAILSRARLEPVTQATS